MLTFQSQIEGQYCFDLDLISPHCEFIDNIELLRSGLFLLSFPWSIELSVARYVTLLRNVSPRYIQWTAKLLYRIRNKNIHPQHYQCDSGQYCRLEYDSMMENSYINPSSDICSIIAYTLSFSTQLFLVYMVRPPYDKIAVFCCNL